MTVHEQMCTPEGMQQTAKEWFDCDLVSEHAVELSRVYAKKSKDRVRKDTAQGLLITAAGPLIWLKTWLNHYRLLPVSKPKANDDDPDAVTAILHVGFLSLAETEEMLAKLRREPKKEETNNPARSKMFSTAQKQAVAPIDALAGKVAHKPPQED